MRSPHDGFLSQMKQTCSYLSQEIFKVSAQIQCSPLPLPFESGSLVGQYVKKLKSEGFNDLFCLPYLFSNSSAD